MANDERRMLFDTRGKRKHVIRVVYAILALLMGASLFLVVGPFNLAELTGGSSGNSAGEVFEDQAERIEERLVKNPEDAQQLLALTRARVNAGNSQIEPPPEGQAAVVSPEAQKQFKAAGEAWNLYLEHVGDKPSSTGAQLVAAMFFQLSESGSSTLGEIEENAAEAAKAQRIAAEQQPSLGTLSTLAIYEYFAGDFAAGDKATKQAAAEANSKAEGKNVEKQLERFRQRAKQFQKSAKKAEKLEAGSGNPQGAPQDPFGFGGGGE
jgi:hypothetical protein